MSDELDQKRLIEALVRVEGMSSDIVDIKGGMQRMSDALSKLVLIEDRQTRANGDLGRAFGLIEGHETRIKNIEAGQPLQKQTTDWTLKAIGIVLATLLAAVLAMVIVPQQTRLQAPVVAPSK